MTNLPPSVTTTVGSTIPKRTSAVDTDTLFATVLTDRAPAAPKLMTSIDDWPGSRQSYSPSYDLLDGLFREGLAKAYVQPVAGPAAAAATLNVPGTSGTGLVVTAKDKGEYANGATGGLSVQVTNGAAGSGVRTLILFRNGVEIDRTTDYATNQGAVDYYANHAELVVTIGGGSGLTPVMAKTDLAGGTIDRASITVATEVAAAVNKFNKELGPGQLIIPDWHTDAAHDIGKAHGRNRKFIPDCDDGASKSTISAAQLHLKDTTNARDTIGIPTSWLDLPPLAPGGTARPVPGSLIAGLMARNDQDPEAGPAQTPAGDWGVFRYATRVRTTFSGDTIAGVNDQGDLDAAGCNLIIDDGGLPTALAFNTCASPTGADGEFAQIGVSRYVMSVVARGNERGKHYIGAKLTRSNVDKFVGDLDGMLLGDYARGDLFGDPADDRPGTAYRVTGVYDPAVLNAGRLRVVGQIRPVKGGKFIEIVFTALDYTTPIA